MTRVSAARRGERSDGSPPWSGGSTLKHVIKVFLAVKRSMARPVKSVQLQYEEGPKLSLACLRNRIERLESLYTDLCASIVKLQRDSGKLHEWVQTLHDGTMSQVIELQYTVVQIEEYLDNETKDLPEEDLVSSQQLHADQLRANRM